MPSFPNVNAGKEVNSVFRLRMTIGFMAALTLAAALGGSVKWGP
jgi:hypothetical protein